MDEDLLLRDDRYGTKGIDRKFHDVLFKET